MPVFAATAGFIPIANRDGVVIITCSVDDPLIVRTGNWCQEFLTKRGFRAELKSGNEPAGPNQAHWILETEADCRMARSIGVETTALATARADSFVFSIRLTNSRPVVSIVGKNPVGLRSGIARLVGGMVEENRNLLALQGTSLWSPFFPIRELVVANRGVVLKDTPYADTLWRRWDDDRIRTYAEQLWLFGFNSIQVCEGRSFRITPDSEPGAREVANKLGVLADAAHENGLLVSQLVWGQAPFNRKICWNAPDSRAVMEAEFRWMARTYGAKVDHVVMNMRDPGGCDCGKCDDYQTPQEIAAFVLKEYRRINPKVTLTLSTWFNKTFWAFAPGVRFLGDTGVQFWVGDPKVPFRDMTLVQPLPGAPQPEFLDETFCPREIGIALHKWYNAEKAQLVIKSGRAADVWGWYLSDQETTTDMSLCMQRLEYYFRSLPRGASEDIRRMSTELCFHGWPQIINAYISGQKMWAPQRNLREIEREFCAAMFGEENADRMVQLYEACELVANPKRGDTCLPSLDVVFGNRGYNERFRGALEAGRRIVLDPSHRPRFSTATKPQVLLDYLIRHLTLITLLSDAQERLNAAIKGGAGHPALEARVKEVEQQAAPFADELLYPALILKLKSSIQVESRSK